MHQGFAQRDAAPTGYGAITAPAKINLTLEVLARRPDGYHGVRSVMVPVGWYDRLRWEPAEQFAFVSSERSLQEGNIIARACERLGIDSRPLRLTLEKQLPTGGGLGGGSSDAAAVLRAAMSGAFGPLGDRDWTAIARALGSDVAFFLVGTGALVEGTGERVTAAGRLPAWWTALYVPTVAVATGPAYELLDAARVRAAAPTRPRNDSASVRLVEALQRAAFDEVVALAQNDFEPVIAELHPPIATALAALRTGGARLAMLSGSGSCVFALAETETEAKAVAEASGLEPDRVHVVPFVTGDAWR